MGEVWLSPFLAHKKAAGPEALRQGSIEGTISKAWRETSWRRILPRSGGLPSL